MVEVTHRNILLPQAREPIHCSAQQKKSIELRKLFKTLVAGALVGMLPSVAASEDVHEKVSVPVKKSGTLFIAGGGPTAKIDHEFQESAGGANADIVVIPTASLRADTPQDIGVFWKPQKVPPFFIDVFHAKHPTEADMMAFAKRLKKATGVWFSGGEQARLLDTYLDTPVHVELKRFLAEGGVMGGTSAGAAVMGDNAIRRHNPAPKPELGRGFGFLEGAIVEQHYLREYREKRLQLALEAHPDSLGLGLEEQAGVSVSGKIARVIADGEANVHHFYGSAQARKHSILKDGDTFDLSTGEVFSAQKSVAPSEETVRSD